ncbi:MAG: HI0074 family nucleotidyltransferase substrate-binding subunit [Pseudomonadota bacterium]
MERKEGSKFESSLIDLKEMLAFFEKMGGDEPAAFFAVVKCFEVAVEYGWKELKQKLREKGVEDLYAPKDVIRKAAQMQLIDNAETWLDYVDARNSSVHDYYGMSQSEYIALIRRFLKDAKKVL